ncbi:MAG: multidrug efflux SMR transporter [Candidatus Thiodiazotropha sp. (ex. Lucinisca nassula)]|nr:multidrug efflux SMR transporter [Candidatus Thiodiazotropha sp. (ex. Lucinisca nassula)]MCG8018221.1 multidrug efflux SMR transporter [Candidatus Thiodiazotropha sp. 'RUGA']RLW61832.1 MAG: QacE family quaternary ammonium compound efflux SMR transporter [gamma proteobacterium symbiont of Stewartia floridana]MBW9262953.1 multidrug efflux SMR transporter [Candidatus Thiodiazotropha sp. (ex. Lucinisca nassula)]MBW9271031.1 multidrug efflux SMR transporter [Candidatus Thiodiazotropha sp. (ex. Lu
MAWLWLMSAGFFEVFFAIFLKLSDGFTKPLYTLLFVLAAGLSFYCLTKAMQIIPIGTAYAVWTGIGTAGVALLGVLLFAEPVTGLRLLFMATLIISIIGLKLA